jgi:hypothetical protein
MDSQKNLFPQEELTESTALQPGSPVNHSRVRGKDKGQKTKGSCGLRLHGWFAKLDPSGSYWRTYQGSLALTEGELSDEFCQTWPAAGTMRNGICSRQPPLVPRTSDFACFLLPTPASRDYRSPNKKPYSDRGGGKKGEQLPNAIGGSLNPTWVEWLMGYPLGWTDLNVSVTP